MFDDDETRILKAWLARAWSADLDAIMDRWEIGTPDGLYCRLDAAGASIVLERVEAQLSHFALPGKEVVLARKVRPRRASRRVESLSRHLFTINWAGAAPWPMAYYATRIPDGRALITASGNSPESLVGVVTDVAIGWVQEGPHAAEAIGALIQHDWARWRREIDQARWAYVLEAAQFDTATVSGWADAVWPTEADGED